MALTDEYLGIEQQTGLEQTVHRLIGTVHHRVVGVVLGQSVDRLVEFGSDEVIDLLA